MLEFSIFVQKESHLSFGNIKAGSNLTGEYSRKSKFHIQLDSASKLVSLSKILIIMHNLGGCCGSMLLV